MRNETYDLPNYDNRVKAVIRSCENLAQYQAAERYAELYFRSQNFPRSGILNEYDHDALTLTEVVRAGRREGIEYVLLGTLKRLTGF